MLALLLKRVGKRHEPAFGNTLGGKNIGDLRLAGCDGAGFVKHHDVDLAGTLQRLRGLEKNTVLCAHSIADHDGDRSREAERAGAGDDENRDCPLQGIRHIVAEQHPDDKNKCGDSDDGGDEYA